MLIGEGGLNSTVELTILNSHRKAKSSLSDCVALPCMHVMSIFQRNCTEIFLFYSPQKHNNTVRSVMLRLIKELSHAGHRLKQADV
jgi:hypothetical protein